MDRRDTSLLRYVYSQSPNAVPRRMAYSTIDKQVNADNYNAAVSGLQGGDKITSRVWWDTPWLRSLITFQK
ncbi:MAG TPA: SusD/RagB family nutrient-binding outer membrane lipoprotein [Hanamia sp.]